MKKKADSDHLLKIEDHMKWLSDKQSIVIDWSNAPIAEWVKNHLNKGKNPPIPKRKLLLKDKAKKK